MNDPRDKRYAQLQKKGLNNLELSELRIYLRYAEAMHDYVKDSKSRRSWNQTIKDVANRIYALEPDANQDPQ